MKNLILIPFIILSSWNLSCARSNLKIDSTFTYLRVHYPKSLANDTIVVYQSLNDSYLFDSHLTGYSMAKFGRTQDGFYNIKLNNSCFQGSNWAYLHMFLARKMSSLLRSSTAEEVPKEVNYDLLFFYNINKGDDLTIDVDQIPELDQRHGSLHNFRFKFYGKGALKYKLRSTIDSIGYHMDSDTSIDSSLNYRSDNYIERTISASLQLLEKNRDLLTDVEYAILKSYAIFSKRNEEAISILVIEKKALSRMTDHQIKVFNALYDSKTDYRQFNIPLNILLQSKPFFDAELHKQELLSYTKNKNAFRDSLYSIIKKKYTAELLDKMIVYHLYNNQVRIKNLKRYVEDAESFVKLPDAKKQLLIISRKTQGQEAFNFKLPDSKGKTVTLSDFKGKIIMMDFWFSGCVPCHNFYQNELSKVEDYYANDPSVVFITICIDKSKDRWLSSLNSGQYSSKSVVNLYTGEKGAFSDVIKFYDIHLYPQPVLISQDLRLHGFSTELRSKDDIIKAINQLKNK